MKTPLICAMIVAAASSQAVLIDDFSVPYSNSLLSSTWVDVQTGTMLSGERDVMMSILSNPYSQFQDLDVPGSGIMVVDNGFMTVGRTTLQYDGVGDEAGNTGSGMSLTNGGGGTGILTGSYDRIRIAFLGNDLDVQVTVTARLSGVVQGTVSATRLANSGAGNLDLLMSTSVLAAMDSLTIDFEGAPSADFGIERIEAVPEPASVAALAVGIAALVRRRRVRR